jgi:hypothetical protein
LKEELDSNPAWAATLTGFKDSQEKLGRKTVNWLWQILFCSLWFYQKTLEDYSGKLAEIKVIPYGFPGVENSKNMFH